MFTFAAIAALFVLSISASPIPQASSNSPVAQPASNAAVAQPASSSVATQATGNSVTPQATSNSAIPQAPRSSAAAQTSSSSVAPSVPITSVSGAPSSSAAPASTTLTTATPASSEAPAGVVIGTSFVSKVSIVCTLSPTDPASFVASGSDNFLDSWFDANGTSNWLQNMDQAFNPAGPDFQSTLDCENLDGSLCPPPTLACDQFPNPELRFIELAATNAHDFFSSARQSLVKTTIDDILDVGTIVSDFNPSDDKGDPDDTISQIASGFSIASSILALAAPESIAGDALGLIGGLIGAIPTPDAPADVTQDLTNTINQQLKNVFDSAFDSITSFNTQLFGGSGDVDLDSLLSTLQTAGINIAADSNAENTITKIFSSGVFLQPIDQSPLNDGIEAGLQLIKQGLVGGVLKALNYYVFVDTTITSSDGCTATGSRFFNSQCYILSKRVIPGAQGQTDTTPIDANIILKFDDPSAGYNIDPQAFYQNADDCAGGSLETSTFDLSGGFPKCFFSLPVLKVAGPHVCSLLPSGASADSGVAPGTPANLQIDFQDCGRVVCLFPTLGGGCSD